MSARINIFFIPFLLVIFLINTSIAKAQDVSATPPNVGNTEILQASGASFREGWNFFKIGFDGCSVKNVLDELQANGGSALNVANLFVKEDNWQPYSFLSLNAKDKKISNDKLLAFNSNQNFFLGITKNNCLNPDSQRQAQIEKLTEGGATKQSVMSKIGELPFDLWTRLTNLVNVAPVSQNTTRIQDKQAFDNLTVSGKLTVNDLGITGKVSSGLLAINGFSSDSSSATINTLSNDLYIQNQGLGGVNFLSGKVKIDKDGNLSTNGNLSVNGSLSANGDLSTNGNLTSKKIQINQSDNNSKSAGTATISVGNKEVTVSTTALTPQSLIFVTAERGARVGARQKDPTTISIMVNEPVIADLKVNWLIIN